MTCKRSVPFLNCGKFIASKKRQTHYLLHSENRLEHKKRGAREGLPVLS